MRLNRSAVSLALAAMLSVAGPGLAAKKPKPQPVETPAPPVLSIKTGVEMWRAGDYAGAVAMWQPFAQAGDKDALFNMGQAYKLGRAVPKDPTLARDYFRRAALLGHLPAQANLGIMLFQAGEKPEAVKWLKAAADKNEMRAQYVLGVAHWNGDGVPRSLTLAYAYLARSSALGMTEATSALGNLTGVIAPLERANGWAVATSLAAGNGVPPAFAGNGKSPAFAGNGVPPAFAGNGVPPAFAGQVPRTTIAAIDPGNPDQMIKPRPAAPVPPPGATASATQAAPQTVPAPVPAVAPAVVPAPALATNRAIPALPPALPPARPQASASVPTTAPPPAVAKASPPAMVARAATPLPPAATPAPRPAPPLVAQADPALPKAVPGRVANVAPVVTTVELSPAAPPKPAPVQVAAAQPSSPKPAPPKSAPPKPAPPKPTPVEAKIVEAKLAEAKLAEAKQPSGWRVQLGAFSRKAQAEAAWIEVKAQQKIVVGKKLPIYEASGEITKLQLGPFANKDAARDACARIAFSGRACFVTQG